VEESKKLVEDAEKSAGYQAEIAAGAPNAKLKSRFDFILQKCRQSTKMCIELVMNVVERGASVLSSAFGPSAQARPEL